MQSTRTKGTELPQFASRYTHPMSSSLQKPQRQVEIFLTFPLIGLQNIQLYKELKREMNYHHSFFNLTAYAKKFIKGVEGAL